MGADTVRLLLFLAGIALILGIYFWDRAKKREPRTHAIRKPRREPPVSTDDESGAEREAYSENTLWTGLGEGRSDGLEETAILEGLDDLVREEVPPVATEPGEQSDLSFSSEETDTMEARNQDLPRMILQLNIISRKGLLSGSDIARYSREAGMELGELQIYDRYNGGQKGRGVVLFSLASLLEPGTFPLGGMDEFSTPGVVLFAQLPGPADPIETFEQMLQTAEYLSAHLGGELQDSSHSDLSRQTISHIRGEIVEYKRHLQLARLAHRADR